MTRPWHVWGAFGASALLLAAALAWVTHTASSLQSAERQAREHAVLEESVRLALWRMDSSLAAFLATENARPYFTYHPFYPAHGAYPAMFDEVTQGALLLPSPLLNHAAPYVRLYFQITPDGEATSPQVPYGQMRTLAAPLVSEQEIAAAEERLRYVGGIVSRTDVLALLPEAARRRVTPVEACSPAADAPAARDSAAAPQRAGPPEPLPQQVQIDSYAPAQQARQVLEDNADLQRKLNWNDYRAREVELGNRANALRAPSGENSSAEVSAGLLQPLWVHGELIVARRVWHRGAEYIQGFWLDAPALCAWLKGQVADLLPAATLHPRLEAAEPGQRQLAALPLRLLPGAPATPVPHTRSPIMLGLAMAWLVAVVAAVSVALALRHALALSERRGAFVSAVTHELRTPLTTFRLYTDLLSAGLVPDEAKRRDYIETLRVEAIRLGHLVENVLAYARLERGRAQRRPEVLPLRALLDRVHPRLAERTAQCGMPLRVDPGAAGDMQVRADVGVVEQVLFNLVDNACKYAGAGRDAGVVLECANGGGAARVRVRDYGPGISAQDRRRLFQPFHKSARQAAHSAPGVGLGLALSRRLAREMRGDLRHVSVDRGACLELVLPLETAT